MKDIAIKLIGGTKLQHSLNVASRMESIAKKKHPNNKEISDLYYNIGVLHDIGKSSRLYKYGFHPLDGYLYLRNINIPDNVTIPILLQSWSKELIRHYPSKVISTFEEEVKVIEITTLQQEILNDLNYINWTTSEQGELTDFSKKIESLKNFSTTKDLKIEVIQKNFKKLLIKK